jgi:hypothetical protein
MQAMAISSGDSHAFAMATAMALSGGSNANAYASAISQGIQQHGCGFYRQAFSKVMCALLFKNQNHFQRFVLQCG